ncbi:MAG: 50S ribosomal protein L18 [Alphaproteobacteria bacterium]|nr:50S ribosomal protein L18 [Alphaproteobacteria bacterium]
MAIQTQIKHSARVRRKKHIRKVVHGTADRPRLTVFRSSKHIYAQLIDDESGRTLASASSLKSGEFGGNKDAAKKVGAELAKRALAASIETVVFDRNGYLYHGRVAALADGAREAGLKF